MVFNCRYKTYKHFDCQHRAVTYISLARSQERLHLLQNPNTILNTACLYFSKLHRICYTTIYIYIYIYIHACIHG